MHNPTLMMSTQDSEYPEPPPGRIIFLNGASSSGKSTLAAALQAVLDEPFWHYSIDHLLAARIIPRERMDHGRFRWQDMRAPFFAGFHRSLPAFADGGNNLIVEHIVETEAWMKRLVGLLHPYDVFAVGLHCPLNELEQRELARGDRRLGDARNDFATVHQFMTYDIEVNSAASPAANASAVLAAWKSRQSPSAFSRMAAKLGAA